jgi:hypothetical protein
VSVLQRQLTKTCGGAPHQNGSSFPTPLIRWRVGNLRTDLWAGWELLMMNIVQMPGGAALWRERSYVFSKDFHDEDEVKLAMSRQPHPLAKTFGVVPVSRSAPAEGTPTPTA